MGVEQVSTSLGHSGAATSRADLARQLGVPRAHVTQVLRLLDLAPEVTREINTLGDPLPRKIVSERMLRPLVHLPPRVQVLQVIKLISRA
ncbi:MAG: hypothetical protein HY532_02090 [Chloroflexi bacterium]|nr:hypothetical protein [Chloroflexota bacterium]